MKYAIRMIAALYLTLSFATGCSSVKQSAATEYIPSGSTIGVVSVFDDQAHFILTGFTVFNNKYWQQNVADWQVAEMVQEVAEKELGNDGFFKVKHVEYDLQQFRSSLGTVDSPKGLYDVEDQLIRQVQDLVSTEKLDAVLFIFPIRVGDPFFDRAMSVPDYGMYDRMAYIHAHFLLYDAKMKHRFKEGSVTERKIYPGDPNPELRREDILEVATKSVGEAMKSLHFVLKRHEHMNTKLKR